MKLSIKKKSWTEKLHNSKDLPRNTHKFGTVLPPVLICSRRSKFDIYIAKRNNGGNCMLVNHLLLPLNIKDNGKIIKAADGAFNMEAIN